MTMLLYNVTIGIDKDLEAEWLAWMKSHYLPEAMKSNAFITYKLYKVLTHEDESTVSYSVQYFSDDIQKIVNFLNDEGKILNENLRAKYKDRHVAFNTLLEEQ